MKTIAIIGASGFAREVEWLLKDICDLEATYRFCGFIVSDCSKLGAHDSPVLGDFSWLETNHVDCLVIGIGAPAVRLKLSSELKNRFPEIEWPALVHPSVKMDRNSCHLAEGVILCAGVIGTVNIHFEPFCMVNLSCTLGHESVIGAGSVLNPTVNISGGVTIGSGVLIGTGAQILQYINVGDGAVIGAGAVATKHVAAGTTVVGIPAKPIG